MVGRGREDRVEVEPIDAQVDEIVQPGGEAEQVAALEPGPGRRRVPRFEHTRRHQAVAPREPVGKDLVEDGVRNPGRHLDRAGGHQAPFRAVDPDCPPVRNLHSATSKPSARRLRVSATATAVVIARRGRPPLNPSRRRP